MIKNAFILNFFKLYNMLWSLALPWLKKNSRLACGFSKRTGIAPLSRADIWIQAASAGESYLAVKIINTLRPGRPIKVLVTTMTDQGRDILTAHLGRDAHDPHIDLAIDWLPFDKPAIMAGAVANVRPRIMVLLETEIWPALIWHLKQSGCRVAILNARMSRKSFFWYKHTRFLWQHLAPDLVCAVSGNDAGRYRALFKDCRTEEMKNIKFETMMLPNTSSDGSSLAGMFTGTLPLTIMASVRKQEETEVMQIIKTLRRRFPRQIIAVFPRHMYRINAWKKHLGHGNGGCRLRSELTRPVTSPCVILWDLFGELKSACALASAAFVGGSLKPLGGQNFLEPAILGTPTVIGPYYDDFAWVGNAVFEKGIVSLGTDRQAVAQFILDALRTKGSRTRRAGEAEAYITAGRGGTQTACRRILELLNHR